jgi:uncharacterized membrane protein YsdA (DUF1294 family)
MLAAMAIYTVLINVMTFGAFALDKHRARIGAYRIPESTLLWLAMMGGTPGAILAQRSLRHKTRKEPFRTQLMVIAAAQIACGLLLAVPQTRDMLLATLADQL